MRLTTAELSEIPLPAAWVATGGTVVATTPEWSGGGVDTTQYAYGPLRLLVESGDAVPELADLTRRLLSEFDSAVEAASGDTRTTRTILRSGLQLVAGCPDVTVTSTENVVDAVRQAMAEADVTIDLIAHQPGDVRGGDTVAVALKQLATNAHKHDHCTRVELRVTAGPTFTLRWAGNSGQNGVETSRHPDQRTRWGLGMVRLAADAIGASVLPVRRISDGRSEATFALLNGDQRLTLPIAAIDGTGRIQRATRAWDEETGRTPGKVLPATLMPLLEDARDWRGRIMQRGTHCARQGHRLAWMALKPRGTREFARDVLAGLVHESGLAAVDHTTIRLLGCAQALGLAMGVAPDMWLRDRVRATLASACTAFGVVPPSIVGNGRAAPPPHLIAFLTSQAGGGVLQEHDDGWRFVPTQSNSPLTAFLSTDGAIRLPGPVAGGPDK